MRKRKGKFYAKNEKETMEKFGLVPTSASGAGWIEKEDGYNENILCQLKSTYNNSYRVSLDDIDKLEYHAEVENKIPVFMIQFLDRDEVFLLIRPEELDRINKYLHTGEKPVRSQFCASEKYDIEFVKREKIESSEKAKVKLKSQMEKERKQRSEQFDRVRRNRNRRKKNNIDSE